MYWKHINKSTLIEKIKKSYEPKTCFHTNYDVHISDFKFERFDCFLHDYARYNDL